VLAAAETEPALFRRPSTASVLALLPSAVTGDAPAADRTIVPRDRVPAPHDRGHPSDPSRFRDAAPAMLATTIDDRRPEGPGRLEAAPTVPVPSPREPGPGEPTGHRTAWGGLVYLLATASEAGLPDAALADSALADRPASWVLFHLARRLCTAGTIGGPEADDDPGGAGDPAVRALAGLAPSGLAPEGAPTAAQQERIGEYARRWAAATAARLGTDEDPRRVVTRLASLNGTIDAVPGWVEFRLWLDDVDLAVRRAGLDVDPGFVPWLGAVVVIRYE
jgi:hypothetical protein